MLGFHEAVEGVVRLGYPVYVVTIIGAWKLLGGIAVLVPRFPRLKEWAYAGVTIDLTGASISSAASHEFRVLRFSFSGDKIATADVIADRAQLDALEIATLG